MERQRHGAGRRRRRDAPGAAGLHQGRGGADPLAGAERGRRVLRHHQTPAQRAARDGRRRRSAGRAEQRHYHEVLAENFEVLRPMVQPGRHRPAARPADGGAGGDAARRRGAHRLALPHRPRHPDRAHRPSAGRSCGPTSRTPTPSSSPAASTPPTGWRPTGSGSSRPPSTRSAPRTPSSLPPTSTPRCARPRSSTPTRTTAACSSPGGTARSARCAVTAGSSSTVARSRGGPASCCR